MTSSPRDASGVRYPLAGMLGFAVCAVLAGARSFAAIGEWALDVPGEQLSRLGIHTAAETWTLRKLFTRLDTAALDRQLAVRTTTFPQVSTSSADLSAALVVTPQPRTADP